MTSGSSVFGVPVPAGSFGGIREPQGTQQSKTLVPELVMLLGRIRVKCIRLRHPKLDLVANLRGTFMKVAYTSGREYLITK